MENKTKNMAVSPTKADRLFWLGRYTERVMLMMHILRKRAQTTSLPDLKASLDDLCDRLGISLLPGSAGDILGDLLFSASNESSVVNNLEYAKNNAMLVRGDIKSETLAYIEIAVNFMKRAVTNSNGLYSLQFISDSMLAFWGAVDENVRDKRVRNLLYIGRYVEKLDIEIRFDYARDRILETLERLEAIDASELALCDANELSLIKERVNAATHNNEDTLDRLNSIFAA